MWCQKSGELPGALWGGGQLVLSPPGSRMITLHSAAHSFQVVAAEVCLLMILEGDPLVA